MDSQPDILILKQRAVGPSDTERDTENQRDRDQLAEWSCTQMMANNVMERVRRGSPDSEKINAGLTLIFSEAARNHIQGGNLDKATLCVVEAVRCLSALSSGHSTLTEQGIDLVAATGGRGGVVRCQNVG